METAILSNRLWVPRGSVAPTQFEAFTYHIFDSYNQSRFTIETFQESHHYWGFSRGDLGKVGKVFGRSFEIDDQRIAVPLKHKLKFRGELKEEQKRTLREWIGYGYGLLQAPPRWGKTVWLTALLCKLKQRALMIAHQEDLCHQLEETIRSFTNINELEEECGKKLCGVLQEWDDFFPVVTLSTYQCFAVSAKGKKVIRSKKDDFGLVMVDEAHCCATGLYTEVISSLNAAYRCGVTATPERKDDLHCIVSDVLGPVNVIGIEEQLDVDWSWENTGIHVNEFSNWGTMWNRLVKKKSRNKKIAKKVVEDVRAGHFVLVCTERLAHIDTLKDEIESVDPDISIGILTGRTRDREQFRKDAKKGKYHVVLAISKIVQFGYNVPRWSCLHNVLPMTNKHNWYQRISRIRTPMEPAFKGDKYVKPRPVARVWMDYGHKAIWAYKHTVRKENDRLGFTCLNPDKPRGKRKGLATFEGDNG